MIYMFWLFAVVGILLGVGTFYILRYSLEYNKKYSKLLFDGLLEIQLEDDKVEKKKIFHKGIKYYIYLTLGVLATVLYIWLMLELVSWLEVKMYYLVTLVIVVFFRIMQRFVKKS